MPIYCNAGKIGSIYYGANKIGKVYDGANLVYQSSNIKEIPGQIYWDARNELGLSVRYRFYNVNKELIYEGTSTLTTIQMQQAYYYENVNNNTTPCFASKSRDSSICPISLNTHWDIEGNLIGATVRNGFHAATTNGTYCQNWVDEGRTTEAGSMLYQIFYTLNRVEKPYGYSSWTFAGFDDIDMLMSSGSSGTEYCVHEVSSTNVFVRYYENSKWKTREREKSRSVNLRVVAHFY